MTAMYNNLQAAEKENDDPNKDKLQCYQRKKIKCTEEGQKRK